VSDRKYEFTWDLLGNIALGRPNLGPTMRLEVYRLMEFTFRDILERHFGAENADAIFREAGFLAGTEFYKNFFPQAEDFNGFARQLQGLLSELGIGILRVEKADMANGALTLTVSEDLDCSGLPEKGYEICTYDEGFLAGLLQSFTGSAFEVKEIDCWSTGDRTCRFTARRKTSDRRLDPGSVAGAQSVQESGLDRVDVESPPPAGQLTIVDEVASLVREMMRLPSPPVVPLGLASVASLRDLHRDLLSLREFLNGAAIGDFTKPVELGGYVGGALKTLQASLKHLTWQSEMVAAGDFTQRVAFMGEFAKSFNSMVMQLDRTMGEVRSLNAGLEQRVAERTEELRLARDAAEAASRAKTAFLAVMGHELRTPLNGVLLAGEMLRSKNKHDAEQMELINIVLSSGSRLLQMVEGVLEFAAVDKSAARGVAGLEAVCAGINDRFRDRAAAKELTPAFDLEDALPPVQAGEDQLGLMLRRLFDNAVKFTPRGGRIAVTARMLKVAAANQVRRVVRIVVSDTGPGLRPQERDRIFEPFVQLETSYLEHSIGTGLGLTLARRQAEAHDGRLWAESEGQGKGSSFILELPLAPEDEGPTTGRPPATQSN
jgi:signal transduction histidine kinase/predicted hydrocarbon binding protein